MDSALDGENWRDNFIPPFTPLTNELKSNRLFLNEMLLVIKQLNSEDISERALHIISVAVDNFVNKNHKNDEYSAISIIDSVTSLVDSSLSYTSMSNPTRSDQYIMAMCRSIKVSESGDIISDKIKGSIAKLIFEVWSKVSMDYSQSEKQLLYVLFPPFELELLRLCDKELLEILKKNLNENGIFNDNIFRYIMVRFPDLYLPADSASYLKCLFENFVAPKAIRDKQYASVRLPKGWHVKDGSIFDATGIEKWNSQTVA